jgi:hypothetical protein
LSPFNRPHYHYSSAFFLLFLFSQLLFPIFYASLPKVMHQASLSSKETAGKRKTPARTNLQETLTIGIKSR